MRDQRGPQINRLQTQKMLDFFLQSKGGEEAHCIRYRAKIFTSLILTDWSILGCTLTLRSSNFVDCTKTSKIWHRRINGSWGKCVKCVVWWMTAAFLREDCVSERESREGRGG
jgi:hypothetical protein